MKKIISCILIVTLLVFSLAGCGEKNVQNTAEAELDPDNPVSLTIWHYYNGTQQATFDNLIEQFNASVGKEKGIYVKGYSHGSVSDLEKAIKSALKEEVGADKLPDIFSSYADTAYMVQKADKLTDLTQYFSKEELNTYVDNYVEEGYFTNSGALYLLPVAKSTEILMLNKTDWEPFAKATGSTLDELKTIEGVTAVAERYYKWTDAKTPNTPDDGKAFYGRDSMANYMIIGMKQMGTDIFASDNGKAAFHLDKKLIRRLWDNYYVPYVKGYFTSFGKFRSDDVKTGDILAYTGSTSSSFYFPDTVENGKKNYNIDYIVQDAPIMKGGKNYKVQQGAGMAVTKSDALHEYASSVFLKWFTQKEQNLQFVCDSGYLPVRKDSNSTSALDQVIQDDNIKIDQKSYDCLKTTMDNFSDTTFYTTPNVENGYNIRNVLNTFLSDQAEKDRKAVEKAIAAGTSRQKALKKYITDQWFDHWYDSFCDALLQAEAGK